MALTSADLVRFAPPVPREDRVERLLAGEVARWRTRAKLSRSRVSGFISRVRARQVELAALDDDTVLAQLAESMAVSGGRGRSVPSDESDDRLAGCFAVVTEMAVRRLGLQPYDVQLQGAWVLWHGLMAEMHTGEGKSLTAALAAAVAAVKGRAVHVVTVNDYLARRDADAFEPLFAALGLSVGCIVEGMPPDQRGLQYAREIVYCSNKELAFDYLKDRLAHTRYPSWALFRVACVAGLEEPPVLLLRRGLDFAIVDEADSVLIDEARVPLIIAREQGDERRERLLEIAVRIASRMRPDRHFTVDRNRRPWLTDRGRSTGVSRFRRQGALELREPDAVEWLELAVRAVHLMHAGVDYVVKDGKVQIVDEFTGRLMTDRSWERGLHQLVEIKEGCAPTPVRETLARTSYQRFFPRYRSLAGMTGTASEVSGELQRVYGLQVCVLPTHRPVLRAEHGSRVFLDCQRRDAAVVEVVAHMHSLGRPVLIGTRSVAASERIASALRLAGLEPTVLNAVHHAQEAQIVAGAGMASAVTVATNMAGRGTDISLGPGVAERGGLHVIATERHESRRIDRQLFGRGARQGDPGSCEELLSLDDELARQYLPPFAHRLLRAWASRHVGEAGLAGRWAMAIAQHMAEMRHTSQRRALLKSDEQLEQHLGFSPGGRD